MKLVALVFSAAVVAIALASAGACSVSHRSGDFACNAEVPCSSDRTCVDGYCVLSTDMQPGVDASVCPAQCTSCSPGDKACRIDCSVSGSACAGPIICPDGWSCEIACNTDGSCRSGVDCTGSASCNVTCSGVLSCRDIECGGGACEVECSGTESCRGEVLCADSCACDVRCTLAAGCNNLSCKSSACDVLPRGCTSAPASCNTCP